MMIIKSQLILKQLMREQVWAKFINQLSCSIPSFFQLRMSKNEFVITKYGQKSSTDFHFISRSPTNLESPVPSREVYVYASDSNNFSPSPRDFCYMGGECQVWHLDTHWPKVTNLDNSVITCQKKKRQVGVHIINISTCCVLHFSKTKKVYR